MYFIFHISMWQNFQYRSIEENLYETINYIIKLNWLLITTQDTKKTSYIQNYIKIIAAIKNIWNCTQFFEHGKKLLQFLFFLNQFWVNWIRFYIFNYCYLIFLTLCKRQMYNFRISKTFLNYLTKDNLKTNNTIIIDNWKIFYEIF